MNDKIELLEEVDLVINPKKDLDFTYLLTVLLSIVFVCMLFFPKIYIQQQIYFKSRGISKLKNEYDILKEENKLISTSVESIKFKNQILDTMF
ncbi:MAG: hypothetical protein COB17_05235 [Sulfurimonas sp.]|nr:MAG: hypothetical protein COB17_05235 [Sulfurimonas sp.]